MAMKYFLSFLLLPLLFTNQKQEKPLCKNARFIIEQSVAYHDPAGEWKTVSLDLIIREPRVQVSDRFSNVALDNETGAFSLERNRGEHISTHLISPEGKASTLLDNKPENDPDKIKAYRLQPERNTNYREYYRFFYGLPMNLNSEQIHFKKIGEQTLNGQKLIAMDFELEKAMIAKTWRVFFSPEDYRVAGVQTMDKAEGEYLIFNGEAELGQMKLPRFRHWYDSQEHTYLGSDILVNAKLLDDQ